MSLGEASNSMPPELPEGAAATQAESEEAPGCAHSSSSSSSGGSSSSSCSVERCEPAPDVSQPDESSLEASHWDLLPDVCLQRVLLRLSDHDRVQASLVCHRWRRAALAPALWRSRRFCFTGRSNKKGRMEMERALVYARHLGAFLEELEVRVLLPYRPMVTVARRIHMTLKAFLLELCGVGARLRVLTIRGLGLQRESWTRKARNGVAHALTNFLGHMAAHLLHLDLSGCLAEQHHGMRMVEAVARSQEELRSSGRCSKGITSLHLEGLFSSHLPIHSNDTFPPLMAHFHRVEQMSLSYSYVSDELLQALGSSASPGHPRHTHGPGNQSGGRLKCLMIRCHFEEPHAQVVSGLSWAFLAQRCPDLRVEIYVEGITNTQRLERILLPQVPLNAFTMSSCNFQESDNECKPVFRDILPDHSSLLEVLSVEIDNCFELIDEELLELVMKCKNLHTLEVNAYLEMDFVEQLLQYCQESSCLLRHIDMKLCYLCDGEEQEEEEEEKLGELMAFHRYFLHPNLQLSVELYPIK